jgi:hypothetical protein
MVPQKIPFGFHTIVFPTTVCPPNFVPLGFMLESSVKFKGPLENEWLARGGEKPP